MDVGDARGWVAGGFGAACEVREIDIEAEQEIASQAGVTGTPTVQLFLNKELKQSFKGVKQRSEFKAAIEALLAVAV